MSEEAAARRRKPTDTPAEPARRNPMFEARQQPLREAPRPILNLRDPFDDPPDAGPRSARQPSPLGRVPASMPRQAPQRTSLAQAEIHLLQPAAPARRSIAKKSLDLQQADALARTFAQPRPAYTRSAAHESPGDFLRGRPWMLAMIALASVLVFWFASASPKTIISTFGGSASSMLNNSLTKVFKTNPVNIPAGQHSLLGEPTLSAQFVDQVLAHYGSPAQGTGAIWLEMGRRYGIDPAYALAFFIHESSAGTNPGWAGLKPDGGTTHNVGNIICAGYGTCFGRFRDYASWDEGIEDWYKLIATEYVNDRGVATIEQIIPIYAPSFENDVGNYVQTVVGLADTWRQGVVR